MTYRKKYLVAGISALALACPFAASAQTAPSEADGRIAADERPRSDNDIIVTATRREETVLDVPLSIAAYSQDTLDQKGIRNVEDLARNTPGVTLNQGFSGIRYIAIRGLQSSVGATMTGIYIDDTPVHIRSLVLMSFFTPALYDLERVEVLRGPQGTLFGSSAMGGAVRFITAKPTLDKFTGNARAEVGFTEGGDPTYEMGGAVGGPIVEDKLGFRASAYYRRDGGYIDRVPFYSTRGTAEKNSNSNRTLVLNGSLLWKPTEDISITPSIFYQKTNRDDQSTYWTYGNGSTRAQPPIFESGEGIASKGEDEVKLYQLKGEWDMGPVSLISNTAFIDRRNRSVDDGTAYILDIFDNILNGLGNDEAFGTNVPLRGIYDAFAQAAGGSTAQIGFDTQSPGPGGPNCGECTFLYSDQTQRSFSQELRLQSNNPDSRIQYVFGAFYQNSRQRARDGDSSFSPYDNYLYPSSYHAAPPVALPFPLNIYAGILPPFFLLGPDGSSGYAQTRIVDKNLGFFGSIDFEIIENLTLTAGARYSRLEFESQAENYNAVTNATTTGPLQRSVEKPFTPKIGITYEASPNLMVYASAAKGFRSGGVNTAAADVDPGCLPGLEKVGYSTIPATYKSDSVWSYEFGAKGRVGNVATFAASAFQTDWTGVQRSRQIEGCAAIFTDNFGKARARGLEAQVTVFPVTGLTLDANIGYIDATQRETIFVPGTTNTITRVGDRFSAPWTVNLTGMYETPIGPDDLRGYGTVQWTYKSGYSVKPGNVGFNPILGTVDDQRNLNARMGVRTGNGLDVSLFVNNLTNSRDIIGRLHFQPSERIQVQTWRPRTWGITAGYHF
ncbi:TonB-dependent receptor [Sphingopyxis panaciterrae]